MSERDKSDRKTPDTGPAGQQATTTVLLAAASLLSTSLGVAAATPVAPSGPGTEASSGQNAGAIRPGGQDILLALDVKTNVPPPHVHVHVSPPHGNAVVPPDGLDYGHTKPTESYRYLGNKQIQKVRESQHTRRNPSAQLKLGDINEKSNKSNVSFSFGKTKQPNKASLIGDGGNGGDGK